MKNCTMIVFFLNAKFGIPETFTHFYLLSALFRFTDFFHAKGNRCAGNPLQNLNVRFISFPTPLPSFLFCLFVFLYYCSTIILSLFLSSFFLSKYGVSVIFPQEVTRISNVKKDDTCKRFLPTEKFNVNFSTCSSAIKIRFQVIYPY